jgi:DtxR family Mn-dependent transcriptional regulator
MIAKSKNKIVTERSKPLSASLEDYLEAIYWVSREHGVGRVSHIAERMKVGKPSVTAALKHLSGKGYVNYDPYLYISLTEEGQVKAKEIVHRHDVLK